MNTVHAAAAADAEMLRRNVAEFALGFAVAQLRPYTIVLSAGDVREWTRVRCVACDADLYGDHEKPIGLAVTVTDGSGATATGGCCNRTPCRRRIAHVIDRWTLADVTRVAVLGGA